MADTITLAEMLGIHNFQLGAHTEEIYLNLGMSSKYSLKHPVFNLENSNIIFQ